MSAPVSDESAWGTGGAASNAAPDAHLREEDAWASWIGARLRLLQASFADDEDAARRDYMGEELERALKEVAPSRRRPYLLALAREFPAGEAAAAASSQSAPPDDPPEVLAARLAEAAPYLSVEQKRALAEQLEAAGLVVVRQVTVPGAAAEPIPAELQRKLGLPAGQVLSQVRTLRLIAALIDFSVTLDQVAWSVWRQLAPKSVVRRDAGPEGDFRRIAGPYLTGDDEVSTAQITQVLDKTRQLLAGLLAGIGATGETFARHFLSRFAPPAIQEAANAEPGFFIGPEQKCWRRYVSLFEEVNGTAVEKEINAALAKYAEDLILGKDRSGAAG